MTAYTIDNQENKIVHKDALSSSLKHLEFILFFEMYLEQKQKVNCSLRFLKAFKNLKQEAQINVLKHSAHCKKS